MFKLIRNQKGAALPFVLIIFMVLLILGLAFMRTSQSDARQTTWQNNRVQAHYLGRSGVEHGLSMLKSELSEESGPYTGTVQQLVNDLNKDALETYSIQGAGNYTIEFKEGIYTRQVRITSVGTTTGQLKSEKTVSYMVDLVPGEELENIADKWITGNNLTHTHATTVDGSLTDESYLGEAVLVQTNNANQAVQSPKGGTGLSTFQASLIAFSDIEGESLRQIQNSHQVTLDSEITLFPGTVVLPPDDKIKPIILDASDMVLQHRAEKPMVTGAPRAPSFLRFNEEDFDTVAEDADGIVGFENDSRYKAFVGQDRTINPDFPGFKEDVIYGVVRLNRGIIQSLQGNNEKTLLDVSDKGYFYFPVGVDLTQASADEIDADYGLNDLIPIDDGDPLTVIIDSIANFTVSDEPGLWNKR